MLNKEICKKCVVAWRREKNCGGWIDYDEVRWKDGIVCCHGTNRYVNINEKPPEKCCYFLEQIISAK